MTLLVRSHDMSIHLLSFQSLRDTRFAVKGYKSCTFCLNQSDTMKRAQKCHEHNSSSWISELFTVKETNPSMPVGSSGECFHSGHAGVWTSFKIKKGLDMGFGRWRDCLGTISRDDMFSFISFCSLFLFFPPFLPLPLLSLLCLLPPSLHGKLLQCLPHAKHCAKLFGRNYHVSTLLELTVWRGNKN